MMGRRPNTDYLGKAIHSFVDRPRPALLLSSRRLWLTHQLLDSRRDQGIPVDRRAIELVAQKLPKTRRRAHEAITDISSSASSSRLIRVDKYNTNTPCADCRTVGPRLVLTRVANVTFLQGRTVSPHRHSWTNCFTF
ncbi:hypothetical protein J6590_028924 [Homalodisca vitripennis]|nr:hypothetical protein J6590_028924 [Homalodisca vitripennis]